MGKTGEGRSLWRSRRGRDDGIKMNLQEMGWESVDRIDLSQGWDRGELRIFSESMKCREFFFFFTGRGNVCFPRMAVLCGRRQVVTELVSNSVIALTF